MLTKTIRLSRVQQDSLIAHIDGPQPIRAGDRTHRSLSKLGLLRYCYANGYSSIRTSHGSDGRTTKSPTHTKLTEPGRGALAETLASFADALSRAGIKVQVQAMIYLALRRAELTNAPRAGDLAPADFIVS